MLRNNTLKSSQGETSEEANLVCLWESHVSTLCPSMKLPCAPRPYAARHLVVIAGCNEEYLYTFMILEFSG